MENLVTEIINLLPFAMGAVFIWALVFRYLIYHTVRRHEWFAREFEKRVIKFVDKEGAQGNAEFSFYHLTKKLLERSFFEAFAMRDRARRRKDDRVMALKDRFFLVKQGCAWLVRDILRQVRFLKYTPDVPNLHNITKSTFMNNPCFNRLFGVFPVGTLNEFLSILPGLFVVAGILGTFLGIRGGLENLAEMDLANLDATKLAMDKFLGEIGFAMTSSIAGIAFSLVLHIWNVFFSPERAFSDMIDRFEGALDLLWYRSSNNELPSDDKPFDETVDAAEALASKTLDLEFAKVQRTRDLDKLRKVKSS